MGKAKGDTKKAVICETPHRVSLSSATVDMRARVNIFVLFLYYKERCATTMQSILGKNNLHIVDQKLLRL